MNGAFYAAKSNSLPRPLDTRPPIVAQFPAGHPGSFQLRTAKAARKNPANDSRRSGGRECSLP